MGLEPGELAAPGGGKAEPSNCFLVSRPLRRLPVFNKTLEFGIFINLGAPVLQMFQTTETFLANRNLYLKKKKKKITKFCLGCLQIFASRNLLAAKVTFFSIWETWTHCWYIMEFCKVQRRNSNL